MLMAKNLDAPAREEYFSVARAGLGIQSINNYLVFTTACLHIRVCTLWNVVTLSNAL